MQPVKKPMLTITVPSNELQFVLLGLRGRLEGAGVPDHLKVPYLAAYLAVERAWLQALHPQQSRFPSGAFLQATLRIRPSRPPAFACFQKSTKRLFARWLLNQSPKRNTTT